MGMDLGLEERVAIVTGASAGLGKAIATTLVEHGARVVLVARGADRLADVARDLQGSASGERALAVPADVSRADDVARVVTEAERAFGRVDILVNNAGESRGLPFLDGDDATWQYDMDSKLMAAVRLSRLVVPGMRRHGGGRIVNILNTGARQPSAASAPTTVTRAAGLALTKVLSKEFAADQILVNAVLIGLVKSDQWVRQWQARGQDVTLDEWHERMGRAIPVGRLADAEELADLVAFLVSARAGYITGAAINFDGGAAAVP